MSNFAALHIQCPERVHKLNSKSQNRSPVKYDEAVAKGADDQMIDGIDENVVMQALDGFLMIVSKDGDVIYASENIHEHIGINQVQSGFFTKNSFNLSIFYGCNYAHFHLHCQIDIVGNPIWEYIHQCDHAELRDILHKSRSDTQTEADTESDQVDCSALIRIKCTLTSRGRSVNIKSASYRVNVLSQILIHICKKDFF